MFRTSNIRGENRFKFLNELQTDKKTKVALTPKQIHLIEECNALSLNEKIELLLLSLGNKLTVELYSKIEYSWNEGQQAELPDKSTFKKIQRLLNQLPFEFFMDTLPKKNRQNGHPQKFSWWQVSINPAVSSFMKNFSDDLTEFEEGVLYGYPLSAIRAYAGLIEKSHQKKLPSVYFLAGVGSKEFQQDEMKYYEMWWGRLREISPKIIDEAEKKFEAELQIQTH